MASSPTVHLNEADHLLILTHSTLSQEPSQERQPQTQAQAQAQAQPLRLRLPLPSPKIRNQYTPRLIWRGSRPRDTIPFSKVRRRDHV